MCNKIFVWFYKLLNHLTDLGQILHSYSLGHSVENIGYHET